MGTWVVIMHQEPAGGYRAGACIAQAVSRPRQEEKEFRLLSRQILEIRLSNKADNRLDRHILTCAASSSLSPICRRGSTYNSR